MTIEAAAQHIQSCRERMDAAYQKPVFDEWVMVEMTAGRSEARHYQGPRAAEFADELHADSAPLYAAMERRHYEIGDFEFALNAPDSRYDACVKIGADLYLLANNTLGTMETLRADPRWREAQKPFVSLTEKFRADPVTV